MKINASSILTLAMFASGCSTTGTSRSLVTTGTATGHSAIGPSGGTVPSEQGRVSLGDDEAPRRGSPGAYRSNAAPADSTVVMLPAAPPPVYQSLEGQSRAGSGALAEPAPSSRPGLATQWGESLSSSMSYAPFVRASAQPFDSAAIFYNDAQGVSQQAQYHHLAHPSSFAGAYHDGVRMSLRSENGTPLPGYVSSDRLYVLGRSGQRYTILVENTTPVRFEAVVSVDGLDVINGRTASPTERGYILPPYGSVTIDGFRQDTNTVAAFRFGAVGDSYAAQTGTARNVGVIGVALFSEIGVAMNPVDGEDLRLRESADPFPGSFATPPPRRMY